MKRKIKFRFFCPPGKSFVEKYSYDGLVEELFEQDDILLPSQFTGLYDKNNKEVYEGDIIEIDKNGFGESKKAVVEFQLGSFGARLINTESTLNFIFMHGLGSFKIIGNIYENNVEAV